MVDGLPGYPSRMAPAAGGGWWLTCFTLRTQLVEFVLREPAFRRRMLKEIDPRYWIAPALNSGNTFLEPMQGAHLKTMGVVKPWAPPRSYGLVIRLDERGLIRYSLHSRFDGQQPRRRRRGRVRRLALPAVQGPAPPAAALVEAAQASLTRHERRRAALATP